MAAKFALLFFAVAMAGVFGQSGFFGPISTKLKAGDFAPNLAFAKVLHAATAAPWSVSNLSGLVTALVFFPDTSHNLDPCPDGMRSLSGSAASPFNLCGSRPKRNCRCCRG
jgi:hypothetical protein